MNNFVIVFTSIIGVALSAPLLLPKPEAKVKLYYYPSPTEQNEIIYNNTESLLSSNIKPATKTILLMDGFQSHLNTPMYRETRKLFSGRTDLNVIVVDWSAYSGFRVRTDNGEQYAALYAHVLTIEMPEMASQLADFIQFISENSNISYKDITLLSLSMGCHAAGQTGRATQLKYNKTIGRIVAEDTPNQFTAIETPFRLQQDDAEVVESYVTDRGGAYGSVNPLVGDLTIYVNGGSNQPCDPNDPPPAEGFRCFSHAYAFKIYNYLDSNATLKACPCRGAACLCHECSFECGNDGISVGPHTPENARGTYHLKSGYLDWSA